MKVQTKSPISHLKKHSNIIVLSLNILFILLVIFSKSVVTHAFHTKLIKVTVYFIFISAMLVWPNIVKGFKIRNDRHRKFLDIFIRMLITTLLFTIQYTPLHSILISSPPEMMGIDTARKIITEHQPLLEVVLAEMRLPTAEEAEKMAIEQPTASGRKFVYAHPDALKSKTIQRLFDLGNFWGIEREGEIITFYGGNYDNSLHRHSYFYFKPDNQPDLTNDKEFSFTLIESSKDRWVYRDTFYFENSITTYTIIRILPNWFYYLYEFKTV